MYVISMILSLFWGANLSGSKRHGSFQNLWSWWSTQTADITAVCRGIVLPQIVLSSAAHLHNYSSQHLVQQSWEMSSSSECLSSLSCPRTDATNCKLINSPSNVRWDGRIDSHTLTEHHVKILQLWHIVIVCLALSNVVINLLLQSQLNIRVLGQEITGEEESSCGGLIPQNTKLIFISEVCEKYFPPKVAL